MAPGSIAPVRHHYAPTVTEQTPSPNEQGRRFGGFHRRTSVSTRLATSALIVTIGSIVVAGLVATTGAGEAALDVTRGRLNTIAGGNAAELEMYFSTARGRVASLAASEMTIDAVAEFEQAYRDLARLDPDDVAAEEDAQTAYYLEEFIPLLEDIRGAPVDPTEFSTGTNAAATYLQAKYIADNLGDEGERHIVTDAGDGSAWTEVHQRFHPTLRDAAQRFGFADIYLIEPEADVVVYSTSKDIAFATSLDSGPHSGTSLARLVDRVNATGRPGLVGLADYAVYTPGFDQPVVFLAAPVFDDGDQVGVIAVQLGSDAIAAILESGWRDGLFGETGDVYLLGSDQRMRSDARLFTEDPIEYFARIDEQGLTAEDDRDRMEALATTILFQDVDTEASRAGSGGEEGRTTDISYQGREVVTAYQPLDIPGAGWVLLAEQEAAEADAAVNTYRRESTIVLVVFVVGLTFLMVSWANSFVNPIRAMSAALLWTKEKRIAAEVPAAGVREFRELADGLNGMVADLTGRRRLVANALSRKLQVLQTILPAAAAERVGSGDRKLLERTPQATVAILTLEGIDEMAGQWSLHQHQDLTRRIIDTLDALAEANGLERVRVMGGSYHAVCGLGAPYLDHAPRALAFCRQAQLAIRALDRSGEANLEASAGLSSGPVTVGLVGDARLVYDIWGETVTTATMLASRAASGEILISESTKDRIPAEQVLREAANHADGPSAWIVVATAEHEGANR
jgi:class 3 adenylate cyclase